jgi:hypothetical protein
LRVWKWLHWPVRARKWNFRNPKVDRLFYLGIF